MDSKYQGHTPGCVEWSGAVDAEGYGRQNIAGKWRRAHRVAYERAHGAVLDGLVLDHACRNRRCVNVAHLEPVTNRENILRGTGPSAQNARRESCVNDHPLAGDNLITQGGRRACRECGKARWRRYRARKVASGEWPASGKALALARKARKGGA